MSKFKIGQKFIHTNTGQMIEITEIGGFGAYYVKFEDFDQESIWDHSTINKHLKAGTWKLPIGYQTPLWKVLNGESIEDE